MIEEKIKYVLDADAATAVAKKLRAELDNTFNSAKRGAGGAAKAQGRWNDGLKAAPEHLSKSSAALLLASSATTQLTGRMADGLNKITAIGAVMATGGAFGVAIGAATIAVAAGAEAWSFYTREARAAERAMGIVNAQLAKQNQRLKNNEAGIESLRNELRFFNTETREREITLAKERLTALQSDGDLKKRIALTQERIKQLTEERDAIEEVSALTNVNARERNAQREALQAQIDEERRALEVIAGGTAIRQREIAQLRERIAILTELRTKEEALRRKEARGRERASARKRRGRPEFMDDSRFNLEAFAAEEDRRNQILAARANREEQVQQAITDMHERHNAQRLEIAKRKAAHEEMIENQLMDVRRRNMELATSLTQSFVDTTLTAIEMWAEGQKVVFSEVLKAFFRSTGRMLIGRGIADFAQGLAISISSYGADQRGSALMSVGAYEIGAGTAMFGGSLLLPRSQAASGGGASLSDGSGGAGGAGPSGGGGGESQRFGDVTIIVDNAMTPEERAVNIDRGLAAARGKGLTG